MILHLVHAVGGNYEDAYDYPVKAFSDESDARKYVDFLTKRMSILKEIDTKIRAAGEGWMKNHPAPQAGKYPQMPSVVGNDREKILAPWREEYLKVKDEYMKAQIPWVEERKIYLTKLAIELIAANPLELTPEAEPDDVITPELIVDRFNDFDAEYKIDDLSAKI